MRKNTTKTSLFRAALSLATVLIASNSAKAQYMSFFGDSTWQYHVTYITQPPEDYLNYLPEEPNLLGVYCRTLIFNYSKDSYHPLDDGYYCVPLQGGDFDWTLQGNALLSEDTMFGRLYIGKRFLICDMSLSEGDTFRYDGICYYYYDGVYAKERNTKEWIQLDTIRFTMIVDSVRYVSDRKTIYLSLLDHQDDYFFGTGNGGRLSDYNLSIRFIEGLGSTYGITSNCDYPHVDSNGNFNHWFHYFDPWLGLLQCMYKDDSLVYMADETLGCSQTCVGVQDYPQIVMNLYPNPATQYVVLDMSTGEEMDGLVVITDMLGRQCLQQKAEGIRVQIPVAGLPTGMYFLTYTDGKRTVTRKFLKE